MSGSATSHTHPQLVHGSTTLRRFDISDAAAFAAIHQDSVNVMWTGSQRDMDAARAADYIAGPLAAGWESGGQLRFAVVEELAGEPTVVGTISLQDVFSTRNGAEAGGSASVGIKMLPQGRGTGSAGRAVRLLCGWAFGTLGLEYLHWRSAVLNTAAVALARRCGFVPGTPIPGYGHVAARLCDGVMLTLTAAQWAVQMPRNHTDAQGALVATPVVPQLRGERVLLRALTMADAPALVRCCRDEASVRWTTVPLDYMLKHAETFINEVVPKGWRSGSVLTFAMADPATDVLLGTVDLQCKIPGAAAVGINCAPHARGTGAAEAAVRLLLDYASEQLALQYVQWHALVPNWGSRKLAWKLGFAFDGELRGSYNDRGTPRDEWVLSLAAAEPRVPQLPWTGPAPTTR